MMNAWLMRTLPLLLWASSIAGGMAVWTRFDHTPGASLTVAQDWPSHTSLSLSRQNPTLLVFLHPQCPCSRATVQELQTILNTPHSPLHTVIVAVVPPEVSTGWADTPMIRSLPQGTDIECVTDLAGVEADRFHAATSGQCFLFSPTGTLLFQGGITPERGQVGPNSGEDAILHFIGNHNSAPVPSRTLVFGCSLLGGCRDTVHASVLADRPLK